MDNKKIALAAVAAIVVLFLGWKFMGGGGGTGVNASPTATPATRTMVAGTAGSAGTGRMGSVSISLMYGGPDVVPKPMPSTPDCGPKRNSEEILVQNKRLANVFVRVIAGAKGTFEPPAEPAVLDQVECMYRPRVQGVVAGQSISIRNSDATGHNVHTFKGEETIFNRAQPTKGAFTKTAKEIGVADGPILFKCDIHPGMTGYVIVNSNPYFGVSGPDGAVTFNLPPGHYKIEAWHEKFGAQTDEVNVTADNPSLMRFEFGAK